MHQVHHGFPPRRKTHIVLRHLAQFHLFCNYPHSVTYTSIFLLSQGRSGHLQLLAFVFFSGTPLERAFLDQLVQIWMQHPGLRLE